MKNVYPYGDVVAHAANAYPGGKNCEFHVSFRGEIEKDPNGVEDVELNIVLNRVQAEDVIEYLTKLLQE